LINKDDKRKYLIEFLNGDRRNTKPIHLFKTLAHRISMVTIKTKKPQKEYPN